MYWTAVWIVFDDVHETKAHFLQVLESISTYDKKGIQRLLIRLLTLNKSCSKLIQIRALVFLLETLF